MSLPIAAAMVVAIPLAMDPGGYFVFLPLKWTLASVLPWAGIAALIIECRRLPRPPAMLAWLVLLALLIASAAFGIGGVTGWIGYPGRYLGVIAWITFFAAFVFGCSITGSPARMAVARATSVASIVVATYALVQAAGIDPIAWREGIDVSRTRSTLGNAAFLGAYLALVVPLSGRLATERSEEKLWRAVHGGAAILGAVALLTTQTRGAWLGALAGVIVVLVLEARRLRARPRVTAIAAGVGVLALVALATVSPYAGRIRSITDPDAFTSRGRIIQWDRTLELIGERPVLGWGPDTYAIAFPRFIDAEFERTVARDVLPDRAHNVLLDLASTTGVGGAVGYVLVLTSIALAIVRTRERDPVMVGAAGGCAAYVVQLQFSFPLVDLDVLFWLFAGLAVAKASSGWLSVDRRWAAVPVLFALVSAVWGSTDAVADRTLRRGLEAEARGEIDEARRASEHAARVAVARAQYDQAAARLHSRAGEASGRVEDFMVALKRIANAQRLVPGDLEYSIDRADILLSWGQVMGDDRQIERAAAGYEEILALDPSSSRAHLKLGVAYVELGREDDAEREWRTAADLAPRSAALTLNLGLLFEQQGRDDEAREMFRAALRIDPSQASAREALERLGS